MKAIWNDAVLAESDDTVVVEGNHYFPDAVAAARALPTERDPHDLLVEGRRELLRRLGRDGREQGRRLVLPRAEGRRAAVAGRVAFWRGVRVE